MFFGEPEQLKGKGFRRFTEGGSDTRKVEDLGLFEELPIDIVNGEGAGGGVGAIVKDARFFIIGELFEHDRRG